MTSDEGNFAKECFETMKETRGKSNEAGGGVEFVTLPLVGDRITWTLPAGEKLHILFCFKNFTDGERSIAINLEVPKRKGLKSTKLYTTPKDGKYWRLNLEPNSYEAVEFTLHTDSSTPKGEYEITVKFWYSKKKTLARAAASIAAGMFLGRLGSAAAKSAIEDEKVYTVKVTVI